MSQNMDKANKLLYEKNKTKFDIFKYKKLYNLKNLTSIQIDSIQFTGTIPEYICNLTQLNTLIIRFTNLNGTIPQCLTNLKQLNQLELRGNDFTGTIHILCEMQTLQRIVINENLFSGNIECFANLTNLTYIQMHDNLNLTSKVPEFGAQHTSFVLLFFCFCLLVVLYICWLA